MHRIVQIARDAIKEHIKSGRLMDLPQGLDEWPLNDRAGVFVCLKKNGELRGCIGTIEPACKTVADETIRNAVSAAACDPRFHPVQADELNDIEYSVDVLCQPEKVSDLSGLDPKKYGVIVSKAKDAKDGRRGLLLPDLDGVDTAQKQLQIAMSKAGISPHEDDIVIERFEVKRFK